MNQDDKTGNVTATIQEIARYNMVLTEAIFELLAEKGILTGVEVKDRVEKLKTETKLQFRWLQWGERLSSPLYIQSGAFPRREIAFIQQLPVLPNLTLSSRISNHYFSECVAAVEQRCPLAISLQQALIATLRQALVENANEVELDTERYPIGLTPKRSLRQVDIVFEGNKIRGLEQNPETKSQRAEIGAVRQKGDAVCQRGSLCGKCG
jgi:hypothetical protein